MEDPQANQTRLLTSGDDLDRDAGALADSADDLATVRSFAERARGDGPDSRVVASAKRSVSAERRQQALDDFLAEASGGEHALSRTDGVPLLMERFERIVGQGLGDLETNGVRAHVDGRQHFEPALGRHRLQCTGVGLKVMNFGRLLGSRFL